MCRSDFNITIQEINKPLVETVEQIDHSVATSSFSGQDLILRGCSILDELQRKF